MGECRLGYLLLEDDRYMAKTRSLKGEIMIITIFVTLCVTMFMFLYQWYFITVMVCFSPEKKLYLAHILVTGFTLTFVLFLLAMRGIVWAKQALGVFLLALALTTFYYALIVHDYMDFILFHDFVSMPLLFTVQIVGGIMILLSTHIHQFVSGKIKNHVIPG